MAIGDINSQAVGTGARYNDGKIPYHFIPIRILSVSNMQKESSSDDVSIALGHLATWQEGGGNESLHKAAEVLGGDSFGGVAWDECARVFEYGAKKYAANNWLKGMDWTVPLSCAVRHLLAIEKGEIIDPESGLTHRGHFLCNVAMLMTYKDVYPEGDDRPKMLARFRTVPEIPPTLTNAVAARSS